MTRTSIVHATALPVLLLAFLLPGTVSGHGQDAPAPTAGAIENAAVLSFRIEDPAGRPLPARLTFVPEDGDAKIPELFPNAEAAPNDLAVRRNVVYTRTGEGRITVPAGAYRVFASRGIEWSLDETRIDLAPDGEHAWTAQLVHEVDTTGWISGDFHLHTLTHSGHGDSNMPERVISIMGEGVEFAVATDHNHHTDYRPTMAAIGASEAFTAVTGNEVSVPIGHFNAFPLDPGAPPVRSDHDSAPELFRELRAAPNADGVVPIVQVNHPRWADIDYFALAGLDPITGTSDATTWSGAFDSIEVLNENVAWGLHVPVVDGVDVGSNVHSVLFDWFNLLNRGHRAAAVGNSDSHTVHYAFAGYPRNFVRSSTDDPAQIDPAEVAAAIRSHDVFTTVGPFVEVTVDGAAMGDTVTADDGGVTVRVQVRAASWIDCDRVTVYVNGDAHTDIDVPDTRDVMRLDETRRILTPRDAWIVVVVEGDDDMAPIVAGGGRPVRPVAVTNPIWVDADGDGAWRSPWEAAVAAVAAGRNAAKTAYRATTGTTEMGLVTLAAAEAGSRMKLAVPFVRSALINQSPAVRRLAARAAEILADPKIVPALTQALADPEPDPYVRIAMLRALAVCDPANFDTWLVAFLTGNGSDLPRRWRQELGPILPGATVDEWTVLGPFDAPAPGAVLGPDLGPETDADVSRTYETRGGPATTWTGRRADASGYLDLRGLTADAAHDENALAFAQTWLHVKAARTVPVALGTDDGSRVYLNGAIVYENPARRGADPLEHVAHWELSAGWNRVVFKVENGGGGFGAYLRVLADGVTNSSRPLPITGMPW